jgi:hypothetical protein
LLYTIVFSIQKERFVLFLLFSYSVICTNTLFLHMYLITIVTSIWCSHSLKEFSLSLRSASDWFFQFFFIWGCPVLQDSFVGHRILGWSSYSFSYLNMSFCVCDVNGFWFWWITSYWYFSVFVFWQCRGSNQSLLCGRPVHYHWPTSLAQLWSFWGFLVIDMLILLFLLRFSFCLCSYFCNDVCT